MRLALIALVLTATQAIAQDRVDILMGSHHANPTIEFEEFNPGVFITWENDLLDWSIGAYQNSYGRISVAVSASLSVVSWETGAVDIFAGAAYYPVEGRYFAVHAGDMVPVGGIRLRQSDFFVQWTPSDGVTTDAIWSFGYSIPLE